MLFWFIFIYILFWSIMAYLTMIYYYKNKKTEKSTLYYNFGDGGHKGNLLSVTTLPFTLNKFWHTNSIEDGVNKSKDNEWD